MVDFATMIKALRFKWIPRRLNPESSNWKTVPNYFFTKRGGLNVLLNCNYNVKFMEDMLRFYQDILSDFSELKALFGSAQYEDTIFIFNNQEILIEGKPFFYNIKIGFLKVFFLYNIFWIRMATSYNLRAFRTNTLWKAVILYNIFRL